MSGIQSSERNVTRRAFVVGASATIAGAVASSTGVAFAGDVSASAPSTDMTSTSSAVSNASVAGSSASSSLNLGEPSQTLSCDVVVVGAGISGLSAAVQSSENGCDTVILEKASAAGGNGSGTEGIFAVGSKQLLDAGIEINPVQVIRTELEESQWRSSGALWYDLVSNAAQNVDWLESNGVEFDGPMDDYNGAAQAFHTGLWWKDSAGSVGYVPGMQASAEANGARFLFGTSGSQLIVGDDGSVSGILAIDENGAVIRIDAKAVILASGGIGANADLLPLTGMPQSKVDTMISFCSPNVVGDGYKMASAIGARGRLQNASIQAFPAVAGFAPDTVPPYSSLNCGSALVYSGKNVWVDQDAHRFTDESVGVTFNIATPSITCLGNRESYVIFDQTLVDALSQDEDDKAYLDEMMTANMDSSVFTAQDIAGLAQQVGLDAETLQQTIETYNGFCDGGADGEFGKAADCLSSISTSPFYVARISDLVVVVDGGITTNIRTEVLDEGMDPIPGLYAVGLDGAMLWQNVYTQNMLGSCVANNVHTGRVAANTAKSYIDVME